MPTTTDDDIQPVEAGPSNWESRIKEPQAVPKGKARASPSPEPTPEPTPGPTPAPAPALPRPAQAKTQGNQQQQHQLPPTAVPYPCFPPEPQITEPPFNKQWHFAKIVLGSGSLVTCAVLWAVGLVLALKYGSYQGAFEFIFVAFAAGFAVIWQIAEFMTICISRKHHGIHPGAHVGLHLIIWLLAATSVGFLITFLVFEREDDYDYYYDDDYSYCDRYYLDDDDVATCQARLQSDKDIAAQAERLESTLLAFSIILLLIHFVLFVRACVETNERNKIPRTRTIYIPVPMAMTGQYGYQALPSQAPVPVAMPPPVKEKLAAGTPPAATGSRGRQPVAPKQSHLYGYYAPPPAHPASAPEPQTQEGRSPSPLAGPSASATTGRQESGTPPRSVSPVESEPRGEKS